MTTPETPEERERSSFDEILAPDEIIVDPTDFNDVVAERNSKRLLKRVGLAALLLLAIAAIVFVAFNLFDLGPKTPEPEPTEISSIPDSSVTGREFPLLELWPEAPDVNEGEATVTYSESTATIGESLVKFGAGYSGSASTTGCTVTLPTDICLSGRLAKADNPAINIFFVKDITRNRIFERAEELHPVEVEGAPLAATLKLPLGGTATPALVVGLPDGSGLVYSFSGDTPQETVDALAASLTVE